MEKRINKTKSLLSLLLAFLMLFTALIIPLGVLTAKASSVGDDVVQEGDYYKFSADRATRFWLTIPLSGKLGYFNAKANNQIMKSNGFDKKRADYTIPIDFRLDSLKYENYPIMFQGSGKVSLPGYGINLIDNKKVHFLDDVKIYLPLSAYNYLVQNKTDSYTITITLYMNGTGLRVDSESKITVVNSNIPFNISGLKLDHEAYDPKEDLPDYEDFNPQLVTDQNFENGKNGNEPQTGWQKFLNTLAKIFGTSANVVQWVLIGVGGIIILSIFIPKRH